MATARLYRCNVSGSIRFKKLILKGDYQTAMDVAKQQVSPSCRTTSFPFALHIVGYMTAVADRPRSSTPRGFTPRRKWNYT